MAKLKRAVSCLLAAMVLLSMCMLVPAAAAAETADGLVYEEVNEEITITGYTGAGGGDILSRKLAGLYKIVNYFLHVVPCGACRMAGPCKEVL